MSRNWTATLVIVLLVLLGLTALSACPKKGIRPGGGEAVTQPQPKAPARAPEAAKPPAEVPPETAAPKAPPEEQQAAPEAPPERVPATPIDGFESLTFGMSKSDALAHLPFNLKAEDAMQQADFARDGDEAYLFKVPYSEYPLLHPKADAKGENFRIAVGFWNGKFEYFTILVSPKHMDVGGWQETQGELAQKFGAPASVSAEEGETTTNWMDAKGRAISVVQPLQPGPDDLYKIIFQSDTWMALFAE